MKRIVLFVLATLAIASQATAVEFTYTPEVRTGFILSNAARVSDEITLSDFFLRWKNGVSFDITLITSLNDPGPKSSDSGNEVDFVLGVPLGRRAGSVTIGTYQLAPLVEGNNDYWVVRWSRSLKDFSFTAEYLGEIGSESYGDKAFLKLGYGRKVEISKKVRFVAPFRLTWDAGVDGGREAFILRFRPEFVVDLGEKSSFFVGWEGHLPLSDRENREFQHASRLGLRLKF